MTTETRTKVVKRITRIAYALNDTSLVLLYRLAASALRNQTTEKGGA